MHHALKPPPPGSLSHLPPFQFMVRVMLQCPSQLTKISTVTKVGWSAKKKGYWRLASGTFLPFFGLGHLMFPSFHEKSSRAVNPHLAPSNWVQVFVPPISECSKKGGMDLPSELTPPHGTPLTPRPQELTPCATHHGTPALTDRFLDWFVIS